MQQHILIPIHTNTYFSGMFPLALSFGRSDVFVPVFLFAGVYPTFFDDLETCRKKNVEYLYREYLNYLASYFFNISLKPIQIRDNYKDRFFRKFRKYINLLKSPRFLLRQIFSRIIFLDVLWEMWELSSQIKYIRNVIRSKNISLLILPADNRYDLSAYVKAAHLEGVGAMVVPQFMAGPLEWAEYVVNQQPFQGNKILNRLANFLYPRWGLLYKEHELVALPGAQIIAREWLGLAPPLPWVLHSGNADAIALESDAVRSYCLAEGLSPEKLIVTGSIAHDFLFEISSTAIEKRSDLCRELGFRENLPIILSALPPDSLYMGRLDCDFKNYSELIEFWCRALASVEGHNPVIVLHPSVRYDDMKFIEDFGVKIAQGRTMNVIPLCDIYVASISSTIQWAIACGKPVLNYDVFRYRYSDYQNVAGVITVEEQKDFLFFLKKLTSDTNYYIEMAAHQSFEAKRWGQLDGKAYERLQNLFDDIIKHH